MAQPLCAILDAHWLGFDINYACARNQRTALVTAANQQLIRLFCAQHVASEIVEHVETWSVSASRSVPVADFLRRWYTEYLPVLRVVPDDAIPDAWLTPDEHARIAILAIKDPDDIPSVKLAQNVRLLVDASWVACKVSEQSELHPAKLDGHSLECGGVCRHIDLKGTAGHHGGTVDQAVAAQERAHAGKQGSISSKIWLCEAVCGGSHNR